MKRSEDFIKRLRNFSLTFCKSFLFFLCVLSILEGRAVNKLKYLYYINYLPFQLEFEEGKTINDIFPYVLDPSTNEPRVLKSKELQKLDEGFSKIRDGWREKSLLVKTLVSPNQGVRISQHLTSHRVDRFKKCLEILPVSEQIEWNKLIESKPSSDRTLLKQVAFLQKFVERQDENRINFYLVGTSWCQTCFNYRVLFETYFKLFPQADLTFHNIIIDDPKEQVFETGFLKELFPNKSRYSHESIPMFIVFWMDKNVPKVLEEGEALEFIYNRYLKSHRGFLENQVRFLSSSPRNK